MYEAISALNKNSLPSGQKEVFEYLAHTYQYVHVPKPNVMRDCLGILFKEGKVYATEDNQYFVNVDSESERTEGEKKDLESPTVKERPKDQTRPRCSLCEEEKGNSPTHARNKRSSRQPENAHLCEKHKHVEKGRKKSKELSSRDTSMETKELKQDKKEKKNNSNNENVSKKPKEKPTKKTVWSQLTGFMKGKSHETKENNSKSVSSDKKVIELTSVATPPKTSGTTSTTTQVDSSFKENHPGEERMTPLGASLNEKQINQLERSRSFTSQSKKRPELIRSNSFTSNTSKKKAIDYDFESQQNEYLKTTANFNQHVRPSSRETNQTFTAGKTVQKNPEPILQRSSTCAVGVVRPYTQASRGDSRVVSRSNSLKDTRKMVNSTSSTPTSDLYRSVYRDLKQSGSSTPSGDIQRSTLGGSRAFTTSTPTGASIQRTVSRDSKGFSSATLTSDTQRMRDSRTSSSTLTSGVYSPVFRDFKMTGSLTTSDFDRPVMRDARSVARSASLREHRSSDITPYSSHRTHANVRRDYLTNDSPLKHLLTKNTGNTLPVAPDNPNYIPGITIQDRSRFSTQNRNSFPNNNSMQRTAWRTMSANDYSDDCIGTTAKGLLIDDNLRKHDQLFSPIYLHQNQRMVPCDCSETGFSENSCSRVMSDSTEHKSVSSGQYQSSFLRKYKNERSSSIYSTSDNGILLDEISSTCSSEIQSIMNQDSKLNSQQSPGTIAKGEVVLDSSLTFIGII